MVFWDLVFFLMFVIIKKGFFCKVFVMEIERFVMFLW